MPKDYGITQFQLEKIQNGSLVCVTIRRFKDHSDYTEDYVPNVKGLDFTVDGLGKFENITHAEAKNAVGPAIEIADGSDTNIWKQGKNFGQIQVELIKFRT